MTGLPGDESDQPELFPFRIECFTEAKDPAKPGCNEDFWGFNSTTVVLSDGATAKGDAIDVAGLSGGRMASQIVTETCLNNDTHGQQLVISANTAFHSFYQANGVESQNPLNRVAASLLCVRIDRNSLIITQVNNSGFRINGGNPYVQETVCDILHAYTRAEYIRLTGDTIGAREFILPMLQKQLFAYQNNADHPLGYGVIDGTETPGIFTRTYRIPLSTVDTLELFTDGYPMLPSGTTIQDWETAYAYVQRNDPNRCLDFPATKIADDRTVLILRRK